jgi:hypothetical protein
MKAQFSNLHRQRIAARVRRLDPAGSAAIAS